MLDGGRIIVVPGGMMILPEGEPSVVPSSGDPEESSGPTTDWPHVAAQPVSWSLMLACGGRPVTVRGRVPVPPFLDQRLAPLATPAAALPSATGPVIDLAADGDGYGLWLDGSWRASARHPNEIACELLGLLAEAALHPEPALLLTHAAGLVVNGVPLLLAAPTQGGKTTLATTLLVRGATLLSDDTVAVAATDWRLASVATSLRVRPGARRLLADALAPVEDALAMDDGTRFIAPQALGTVTAHSGAAAAVVLLDRAPGLRPSLTPLRGAEGLMALVGAGAALAGPSDVARAQTLARWAQSTPFLWMSYDSPQQGAAALEAFASALSAGLPIADGAAVASRPSAA
ncbi:hypothetical protein [Azospirillum sp. B4]|uniref:hypothetical protein n=1 Tax=Azospirillum sp. B4 TaxID=95605 RepID=UPI00034DF3F1|nr:hypothetical protein [Azospirillum sp. B4]